MKLKLKLPGNRMKRLLIHVSIVLCISALPLFASGVGVKSASAAGASRPATIPALKEWTNATGSYTLNASRRIVVDSAYTVQLTPTATTFAEDTALLTGWMLPVVSASAAAPGDIFLTLNATDTTLGQEGYNLTIGSSISISARGDNGAFYGTRTLLQLFKQGYTLDYGSARDWPDYPERNLMVDTARKFLPVSWLKNRIRDLSYLKYNTLHLHLTDNEGFRLESTTHPEIVAPDHYSKAEISDLVQFAAKYHVDIVPEIDMPGHMGSILKAHPELGMLSTGGSRTTAEIDLTNAASYTFMEDLLNEFIPLFPSPYLHIGTDEYLYGAYGPYPQMTTYAQQQYGPTATARDTVIGFINWADGKVRAQGKTLRIWNDMLDTGTAVTVNADVEVEYWEGGNPQNAINEGHTVLNANRWMLYYALNRTGRVNPNTLYDSFDPAMFNGSTIAALSPKNRGAGILIWADEATKETDAEVELGIQNPLRSLAQKNWGSPKITTTYQDFLTLIRKVGNAPGYTGSGKFIAPGNIALGKAATASSAVSPRSAGMAVDGNFGGADFRWLSNATDPGWLQIDLGGNYAINQVIIDWYQDYAKAYDVQMSVDGTNWTTIYSTTNGDGATDDLQNLSGYGRYIRVYGTQRATANGYSILEFQAIGQTVQAPKVNLALGRPASASSMETAAFPANKAFDGSAATRWSSQYSDPQWLQVDLGSVHNIGEVDLRWEGAYGRAYQIQVSDDAVNWSTIYSTTTSSGGTEQLTNLSGTGRYIRMYGTQRTTGYGYSLNEFEVYDSTNLVPYQVEDSVVGTGNNQFEYTGAWSSGVVDHWSNTANQAYQVKFNGTQISLIGAKDPQHGIAAISIDGGAETLVDLYAANRQIVTYYTSPVLAAGPHSVKVRVTGTKNTASGNTFVAVDKAAVMQPTTIEDSSIGAGVDQFTFSSGWQSNGIDHWNSTANAYYEVKFNGSQIKLFGAKDPRHGIAAISVDGGEETLVDLYADARETVAYFTSSVLSQGDHVIRVRVTGSKNPASANSNVAVDYALTN